jgi:hypothetical protein
MFSYTLLILRANKLLVKEEFNTHRLVVLIEQRFDKQVFLTSLFV